MRYFALHDIDGNVRRVVGFSGCRKPNGRGLLVTQVPSVRHRVRKNGDEYEPYLPDVSGSDEATRQHARRRAYRRVAMLEQQAARPLRELVIDPENVEARKRLEAIEAEIEKLRPDLAEVDL